MPRNGSHMVFSFTNAYLKYLIVHRIPIDFTYLMITHLCDSASHNDSILPYGMCLTIVFCHFGVSFESKSTASSLSPIHTYTFDSSYHIYYT